MFPGFGAALQLIPTAPSPIVTGVGTSGCGSISEGFPPQLIALIAIASKKTLIFGDRRMVPLVR